MAASKTVATTAAASTKATGATTATATEAKTTTATATVTWTTTATTTGTAALLAASQNKMERLSIKTNRKASTRTLSYYGRLVCIRNCRKAAEANLRTAYTATC